MDGPETACSWACDGSGYKPSELLLITSTSGAGLSPDALILVTGGGGFVGGHVARALAAAGFRVRALARRLPPAEALDPPIEWLLGDLRNPEDRARALAGVRGVVHAASWVSLASDPRGESHAVNVVATRDLLQRSQAAGIERFVYTSTSWTVGAGSREAPADESAAWNLAPLRSPYSETKRAAERLVLEQDRPGFRTVVLCPSMVIGPRDVRPTSTRLLLHMARTPVALLPAGGTQVVDVRVVAEAHLRALERAESGRRYVLAGPYLSYAELAILVARVAGFPRRIVTIPKALECPLAWVAGRIDQLVRGRWPEVSAAAVSGGFVHFHLSGALADTAFDLQHPPPLQSIFEALDDFSHSGRAPWLALRRPSVEDLVTADASLPSCR
jgi:dihydroflavonol-4-reductase